MFSGVSLLPSLAGSQISLGGWQTSPRSVRATPFQTHVIKRRSVELNPCLQSRTVGKQGPIRSLSAAWTYWIPLPLQPRSLTAATTIVREFVVAGELDPCDFVL